MTTPPRRKSGQGAVALALVPGLSELEAEEASHRVGHTSEEQSNWVQILDLAEVFGLIGPKKNTSAAPTSGFGVTQPLSFLEEVAITKGFLDTMKDPRKAFCVKIERRPVAEELAIVKRKLLTMPTTLEDQHAQKVKTFHREFKVGVDKTRAVLMQHPNLDYAPTRRRRRHLTYTEELATTLQTLDSTGVNYKSAKNHDDVLTATLNENVDSRTEPSLDGTGGSRSPQHMKPGGRAAMAAEFAEYVGPKIVSQHWRDHIKKTLDARTANASLHQTDTVATPRHPQFNTSVVTSLLQQHHRNNNSKMLSTAYTSMTEANLWHSTGDGKRDLSRPTKSWLGQLGVQEDPDNNNKETCRGKIRTAAESKMLLEYQANEDTWLRHENRKVRTSTFTYYPPEKPPRVREHDEDVDIAEALLQAPQTTDVRKHIQAMRRGQLNPLKMDERTTMSTRLGGQGRRFK